MTLKTKLLLGFLVMLVLTGITAYTGWLSMGNMNNQANVSYRVESALTDMMVTQTERLRYSTSKNMNIPPVVIKGVEDSLANLTRARSIMTSKANLEASQKALDFLPWYKSAFNKLVDSDKGMLQHDARMVESVPEMERIFKTLSGNVEKAIREGNTSTAMTSYAAIADAHVALVTARLMARAFTANPSAESAKRAETQLQNAQQSIKAAENSLKIPENLSLAKDLGTRMLAYSETFNKMRDASIQSASISEEMSQRMEENLSNMHKLSAMAMETVVSARSSGNTMAMIVSAFAVVLGLIIAFGLAGNVQKQLGKDPSQLAHIAQRVTDGDYNIDDGSQRQGVYGNLVAMVDALKGHIDNAKQESQRARGESDRAREAMQTAEAASGEAQKKTEAMLVAADKLEEVGGIVSSALQELSAQIEQSERGASEQASRVTETATAMEEMNCTVLEVARNAGQASEVSATTRRKAEDGAKVVQQAVESIQQVQTQSLQLKDDMATLGENAQSINQIMGVISDIADQTNLLALNAAIEAARAGDAGRGFAVVADEVRKLAEKTMQSTTDVGNAIKAIQQSADKSMAQVDAAVHTIEKATGLANQSGVALSEIVNMVDSTADQVRAIATASEQQSATSEEINNSIGQVNAIASETARAMQEASRAVGDLASQAQVLSHLIDDMKQG